MYTADETNLASRVECSNSLKIVTPLMTPVHSVLARGNDDQIFEIYEQRSRHQGSEPHVEIFATANSSSFLSPLLLLQANPVLEVH